MFAAVTLPLSAACDGTIGGDQQRQLYLGDFEVWVYTLGDFEVWDVDMMVKAVAVLGASH